MNHIYIMVIMVLKVDAEEIQEEVELVVIMVCQVNLF